MNNDIKSTFDYIDKKVNDIKISLEKDIKKEEQCAYLSYEVADILANLNKCYDYCATDLINSQDFSNLSDKQLKNLKYCKKYFPVNTHSLEEKNKIYSFIKIVNPDLYNKMYKLVKKISNNEQVQTGDPKTHSDLKYGMVKDIRKLCNNDKHNSSLKVLAYPNTKARVERENGMQIEISLLNCKGHYPPFYIPIGENGIGYVGNSYAIIDFNEEIETFIIHRVGITKKVIEEVYSFFD